MIIVLKMLVLGFSGVFGLESSPPILWPSSHLRLKVRTFFNSTGNVDFENDIIFNPSFNIR